MAKRSLRMPAPEYPAPITRLNLPLVLLQARERVLGKFRPILKQYGLTEQQWRIIRALLDTGPLEPREIVELCGISSPSLAGVLARMDELGLVRRERFENDQRRLMISLTKQSLALASRMAAQIEAVYDDIESRIGKPRIDELCVLLDELMLTLDAVPEEPA